MIEKKFWFAKEGKEDGNSGSNKQVPDEPKIPPNQKGGKQGGTSLMLAPPPFSTI
jgi:hypothetical protein